nr:hypothetical protein [Tanacetum cinerariifolium]
MLSKYVTFRTQILDHPLALENDLGFTNPTIYTIGFSALSLIKEDLSKVPIWIKFHEIRLGTYTSDGLSHIATKLGMMMMLESYMSDMCLEAWGSSYDRATIDIDAQNEMIDTLLWPFLKLNNIRYTRVTICIEYERKPHSCGTCAFFGHTLDTCTKVVNEEDVTPRSVLGAIGAKDGSNPKNIKASDLGAEESESEVVEIFNETTSFMTPNQSKVSSSSTSEGGNRKSSLYDDPYDDDDDDDNGDDDANEEYTEAYMAFYKKFNINLCEDISYNVAKITNGYPMLVLSSLGDHTVEKMTHSGNNKGTHDENIGQTPISSTVDPKLSTFGRNEADVAVPLESIRAISERFVNMAYGFFLGNRMAYLVISSMDGLDAMLENSLWFIYNNPLIMKKWNPDVNLLKEDVGNALVFVKLHGVPMTTFSEDCVSDITTKLGTFFMLDSFTSDTCMHLWGRSSYTRAMIELWADVELKYTIVFGRVQDECPKNIGSNVAKNLKKPSQDPRGVSVSPKIGFKLVKQVYRRVSKKNNANTSGNKKKDAESRKEANSSGYLFWNARSSSTTTTPIVEKIDKLERLIIDGKLTLVDDEGKPLEKFYYSGDHNSEDEVEQVDNEMTNFLASKRVGYGNS